MTNIKDEIEAILTYYMSDGDNITVEKTMADLLTLITESNREAYKKGAMDAIEATKIEQIIYYTNAELMGLNPLTEEQKINFAERVGKESSRMQACSEQENKAEQFLESLKDNSVSGIPI